MILETQRLYLRHFVLEDAPRMSEYRNKEEVAKYQSWYNYSEKRAYKRIKQLLKIKEYHHPHVDYHFAIVLKETDEVIGDIFTDIKTKKTFILGYTLDSLYWSKGYATEIVSAFIEYMAETYQFEKVLCYAYMNNVRSIRLLERLGFKKFEESKLFGDAGYVKKIG